MRGFPRQAKRADKKLLATAALGDTVIIPAIDRLSRDTADLLTIARDMKLAGVGLKSLAEPVIDTTSEFSDIVLAVLGLAARLEHKPSASARR